MEVAETVHAMKDTPKAFRLIVKRTRDTSTPLSSLMVSYRYWCVAGNFDATGRAERVLEGHQLRGQFENFFKGLENEIRVGDLPSRDFDSNAVFFRLGVLAYNLVVGFKRDLLPASCQTWTLRTIRWTLFALPGRVVRHARSLVLRLRAMEKVKKEYETKIEALYAEVGKLSADLSWLKKKSGRLLP